MFGISPVGVKFSVLSFGKGEDTPKKAEKSGNHTRIFALDKDVFTYTSDKNGKKINNSIVHSPNPLKVAERKFDAAKDRGDSVSFIQYINPPEGMRELRLTEIAYDRTSKEFKKVYDDFIASFPRENKKESIQPEQDKVDISPDKETKRTDETQAPSKVEETTTTELIKGEKKPSLMVALMIKGKTIEPVKKGIKHDIALQVADLIDSSVIEGRWPKIESLKKVKTQLATLADCGHITPGQTFVIATRGGYKAEFDVTVGKNPDKDKHKKTVYEFKVTDEHNYQIHKSVQDAKAKGSSSEAK